MLPVQATYSFNNFTGKAEDLSEIYERLIYGDTLPYFKMVKLC
jgi:hypothetical protein